MVLGNYKNDLNDYNVSFSELAMKLKEKLLPI